MPMAYSGVVLTTRYLWRGITGAHDNIYYRYGYKSIELAEQQQDRSTSGKKTSTSLRTLSNVENNLLFNWIMMRTEELTAGVNIGDISTLLRNVLDANTYGNQRAILDDVNNNFVRVDGPPVTYTRTLNLGNPINADVVIQINNGNGARARKADITITEFPLRLLNRLLQEWYNVDIGLPDQQIEIDLRLH